MNKLLVSFGVIAAMVLASSGPVDAKTGPGARAVRQANKKISDLLKQKAAPGSAQERRLAAQVTRSVRGFLDIEELGRRALVDHWPKLDVQKRSEFMKLLRSVIEKNYIRGLRARVSYQVVYLTEKTQAKTVVVSTQIKTMRRGRERTIDVDYVLVRRGRGFRAFDIVTNEVGLVANYRAQFNRIIAKEGFDGLLARVRNKATGS